MLCSNPEDRSRVGNASEQGKQDHPVAKYPDDLAAFLQRMATLDPDVTCVQEHVEGIPQSVETLSLH